VVSAVTLAHRWGTFSCGLAEASGRSGGLPLISDWSGDNHPNPVPSGPNMFGGWATLGRSDVSVPPLTAPQPISA
jgi:hypothetical protein